MRIFRSKLLALLLSCACTCAGAAEDTASGLKLGADGIRLKLQPSLIRIPPDAKDTVPLFVDADRVQGHQNLEIEAEGTVRLRRRGQAIHADWLRYDKPEDEVNAEGNVRLEQRGDVLEGAKMRLNLDTTLGAIEKPKYQVQVNATRGRGEGERLVLEGQNKYRVLGATYTTCDVGINDWFVRAGNLEIDKDRQIATARNASIVFFGQPILYVPYLSFSLDRQRKSGFLVPTVGNSSNSGYEFSIPYYWNIAPNRDFTITPRTMSKRGLMLTNEFRYLDSRYSGEARYEVIPRDYVKDNTARFAWALRHNQRWDNGWNGNLNIQKVSDDTYFTDLSTRIAVTSQSVLPREGSLAKNGTWWNGGTWDLSTLVQRWQTLQTDPLKPLVAPFNRSQIALSAAKQNVGPADLEFFSSAADFSHPVLTTGRRVVAFPSVSVPLQTSFAYLTPKVGMHLTHYNLSPLTATASNPNRAVPIFSAESGMVFERNTAWYGQKLLHALEPKINYVFIPARAQNQLPNFDSALKELNFATLYSENQFSGNDRINDANQVTLGVTSRLLHQDTGIERLRVGLAQRYYFKSQEVTLPGVPARPGTSSDVLAELTGTLAPHWTADARWQYNTGFSQTQRLSSAVHYQPDPGKVVNLSYRFIHNALRQVDLSSQWPLTGRLSGVARLNYSLQDSRLVEGLAGLEYNGGCGCWAFRVVGRQIATASQTKVSSIFIQLELHGVSRIGSNTRELLRRNIAGYTRQELQPTRPDDPFPGR